MTTYCPSEGHERGVYGPRAARSLYEHLDTQETLRLVVANDGPAHQPHCKAIGSAIPTWQDVMLVGGGRVGIGGSLNRALAKVHADDLWLYTTDDWALTQDYNLTQAVKLIRECGYDYVRLGPPHPNVTAQIKFQQGVGWWLELLPFYGGFVFATRPFLANKRFYDSIGPFKEQCDSYVCERDYSDRVTFEHGKIDSSHLRLAEVVYGSLESYWEHIGEVNVGERYP